MAWTAGSLMEMEVGWIFGWDGMGWIWGWVGDVSLSDVEETERGGLGVCLCTVCGVTREEGRGKGREVRKQAVNRQRVGWSISKNKQSHDMSMCRAPFQICTCICTTLGIEHGLHLPIPPSLLIHQSCQCQSKYTAHYQHVPHLLPLQENIPVPVSVSQLSYKACADGDLIPFHLQSMQKTPAITLQSLNA